MGIQCEACSMHGLLCTSTSSLRARRSPESDLSRVYECHMCQPGRGSCVTVVPGAAEVLEQFFELFLSHNHLMSELTLRLVTEANEM